ncbi:MAG: GlsB/YeaQ/YmgE family stress response membrane protein [Dehalococcoidia bacterium]
MGIILTIAVGLLGAVIGGFIGTALGWGEVDEFDVRSIGLAFLGAVGLLLVLQGLSSGRRR